MDQGKHCTFCLAKIYPPLTDLCGLCLFQKQIGTFSKIRKAINSQKQCPNCTFINENNAIQCLMCQFIFEQQLKISAFESKIRKLESIVNCSKCKLPNDISNKQCLNCGNQLFEQEKEQCSICKFAIKKDNFRKHYEQCLLSKSLIQEEKLLLNSQHLNVQVFKGSFVPKQILIFQKQKNQIFDKLAKQKDKKYEKANQNNSNQIFCYYCYQNYTITQSFVHENKCQKKKEFVNKISSADYRMTPLQIGTMIYMHKKCSGQHFALKAQLKKRVKNLGYSLQDLQNLQFYIQNYAPIIIQIHVSKHMQFFLKDTHYRSQFQTNKSSGTLSRAFRIKWQDRMFDKKYSIATDFERVKYGVINFTNDPKGVKCANTYGLSYFLLKNHVRDRCTFTDKDSSAADASISTLKFNFKVASKMSDMQLKAAFNASKALQQSSHVLKTYKQLQIHGPIEFARDVERIYVSREQIKGNKKYLDMVYQFSEKFKVEYDFI